MFINHFIDLVGLTVLIIVLALVEEGNLVPIPLIVLGIIVVLPIAVVLILVSTAGRRYPQDGVTHLGWTYVRAGDEALSASTQAGEVIAGCTTKVFLTLLHSQRIKYMSAK